VGYDNYDYLGNPRLMPEVNYEADLTVRYFNDRAGSFYLNGFFSRVQDFIGAMRIPPSVATPKTQGALGVKQFFNADYAVFRGFEFGYSSPLSGKMGIAANASYTKATICSMKKYLVENNQISGEVNVNNDALPEIPPLEGRVGLSYRFFSGRLMPDFSVRAVNIQNYTSEAFYEPHTPGFVLLDFSVNYSPFKIFSLNAGVRNILNKNYYEHLNRKIIGSADKLYEQGRSFFINMKMEI
jgi:outer membrane receptor protein involved in Fe transport